MTDEEKDKVLLHSARMSQNAAPHAAYMRELEKLSEQPETAAKTEAEVVRDILRRAENHLAYIKAKGSTESTIYGQHQYIEALRLVLTRL